MVVEAKERFAVSGGVRIAALDWSPAGAGEGLPVLLVPGALAPAEAWEDMAVLLAEGRLGGRPRRSLAVSFRGRGASDAPPSGYTLDDHVSDIRAVALESGLGAGEAGFHGTGARGGGGRGHSDRGLVLVAQSMGVPYAVRFVLDSLAARPSPAPVRGVVLGDYPARYRRIPDEWSRPWRTAPEGFADWEEAFAWDHAESGLPREVFDRESYRKSFYRVLPDGRVTLNFSPRAMVRVQEESAAVDFREDLRRIACPVRVLRAARRSLLDDEWAEIYRLALPRGEVVTVDSDHGVFFSEDGRRAFGEFLERCDQEAGAAAS